MLIIFFLLTVALLSLYLVLKLFEPKLQMKKRVDTFISTDKDDSKYEEAESETIVKNTLNIFRKKMKDSVGKKISSKKEINLEKKLLQAGRPLSMTVVDYQVYRVMLNIILPAVFGIYGRLLSLGAFGIIFLTVIGGALSIFIPDYYINSKTKKRYRQAIKELPDFLDLLTVCLEAGLGFDSALNKVISKRSGVISSEFHICIEEIRLGKTRKEALTGVKERLEFDEMRSLINSILQAEKLGISMVQILRIKSQEERSKRKQRAEEEAMKAPIKILFPLVLFIFPSIFAVLLGPAVIQFITTLSKS